MNLSFIFFFNSIVLGIGLAMDAFSVSLANGMNEPCMKKKKMLFIAVVFGVFQGLMPLIGWFCVHTIATLFTSFTKLIPWIALVLLSFLGIKMLVEAFKDCEEEECCKKQGLMVILVQGVATSIDALSVGFTNAGYGVFNAIVSSLIIMVITFVICYLGVLLGKKFGTKFSKKAAILGGIILILIGIEIFLTGILG